MDVKDLRETGCLYRSVICVAIGFGTAVLYSGLAVASVFWGEGRQQLNAVSLSLGDMISLYMTVGIFGGIIVGISLPVAKTRMGAAALGFVVAAAYAASLALLLSAEISFALMFGALCGPVGALAAAVIVWQRPHHSDR